LAHEATAAERGLERRGREAGFRMRALPDEGDTGTQWRTGVDL
jgi:hypothetical protein